MGGVSVALAENTIQLYVLSNKSRLDINLIWSAGRLVGVSIQPPKSVERLEGAIPNPSHLLPCQTPISLPQLHFSDPVPFPSLFSLLQS